MGWIAKLLGTGDAEPSSAQFDAVIAERERGVTEKIEAIARHRADVPAAAVQGNYLPEHAMAALNREVEADRVVLTELRAARERAGQREQVAELRDRWAVAAESADPVMAAAEEIVAVASTLADRIEKLRGAIGAFDRRLPWDPPSRHRIVADYMGQASLAADALQAALRRAHEIRNHAEEAKRAAVAFKEQSQPQEQNGGEKAAIGE